jgi:hypothetical protein
MQSPVDPDSVIAAIERAWHDARRPDKGDILPLNIIGDEEQMGVKRDFQGKSWSGLDAKFIDQSPDGSASALCFMSNEALRYYISAYLIADVRGQLHYSVPFYRLIDGFNGAAYGQRSPDIDQDAARRWTGLDPKQVDAVVLYLRWKQSNDFEGDHATAALELYWLPRANGVNPERFRNIVR